MTMDIMPKGHVTSPMGFQAGIAACGVKKGKDDLVILYSECPTGGAAVFTQNRAAAVPVQISRNVFRKNEVRAVLINSGCANACTGEQGMEGGMATQTKTAQTLGLKPHQVALASTGRIGMPLPLKEILAGIPVAVKSLGRDHGSRAAKAIQTSDTHLKEIAVQTIIDGKTVTIGGMAKGSGMINPQMATMLSFVTTDAAVEISFLRQSLQEAVDETYNMISVDGDASTNDTVMLLANGMAGNDPVDGQHPERGKFMEALMAVNHALALAIVKDGEGATKLVEVITKGFASRKDARKAAKEVMNSVRVKTMLFAKDGYWGRIIGSLGNAGVDFNLKEVALTLTDSQEESVTVMDRGTPQNYSEERLIKVLQDKHIRITITAGTGEGSARGWGCDLSHDYVDISGFYRQLP